VQEVQQAKADLVQQLEMVLEDQHLVEEVEGALTMGMVVMVPLDV
jgi:hypothetical protein